jgi:hypothetical protein
MQKVNVNHGKAKMDRMVRWEDLPCDRQSRTLYRSRVVRSVVPMLKERSKEEVNKRNDWKK